ncbi:hypothetical protein [Nocardia sp. NPDC058480]|uniref:hypothetical protein n=1 Tax=Nocardia sp. NPDC058480 TaxID=3346522 RepID=UPI00364F1059
MDRNRQLEGWLAQTGWSNKEIARQVASYATARGELQVRPDASSVRRWLDGMQPRPPVPAILADIISTKIGIRVTTYDLGLGEPTADRALTYHPSWTETVESVADLGRADVDRRNFLTSAPFAVIAALGPSRDWLLNTLDQLPVDRQRVRLEDVSAVQSMFAQFQQMDVFQGGGTGRLMLAAYMNDHVYPLLRRSHTDEVRGALYGAAAEQTYLLGWMAFDNGEHGIAQRYLIQALRLSEESRDPALGAHVLAGMADQATLMGHPTEGRKLAQAGRMGLKKDASPACLADLWTLEARALAALGDTTATVNAVAEAERAFDRIDPESEPEWARFIDTAYVFGELANSFRDIGRPSEAAFHASRSIEAAKLQGRARRGAMSHAAMAASHVQNRDLEAAHAAGLQTLKLSRQVKSSRTTSAVRDVNQRLRTLGPHPLVADFAERARAVIAA